MPVHIQPAYDIYGLEVWIGPRLGFSDVGKISLCFVVILSIVGALCIHHSLHLELNAANVRSCNFIRPLNFPS